MSDGRRIVVTGIGIVSSIGLGRQEVLDSLKNRKSGIKYNESYKEAGMRSCISGTIEMDTSLHVPRRDLRFMGDAAAFAYVALKEAIEDAGLSKDEVSCPTTGIIAGAGGHSSSDQHEAMAILKEKGLRKVGPYRVTRVMGSSVSACLASPFDIKGMNFSISSACATSSHNIMIAADQIRLGNQEIMLTGGAEEEHWTTSALFDAMGALSTSYNDTPDQASRPWDEKRDGFVIAGGAGFFVLESLDNAIKNNRKIYAELVNYSATSDGEGGQVAPAGDGSTRCMKNTIKVDGEDLEIDYINAHATSTPVGDIAEIKAISNVFGDKAASIPVSSTKSYTGHSLGAAGVHEAIYSLLMMENDFIAGTLNLHTPPEDNGLNLVQDNMTDVKLNRIISNSFGFGGTNACLMFGKAT